MKRLNTSIIALLMAIQVMSGQDQSAKLESFRSEVLTKYTSYFSAAGLDENGQLRLTAQENFGRLESSGKQDIMNILLRSWQETLVVVHLQSGRELWSWNNEAGMAQFIDAWDLNPEPAAPAAAAPQSDIARHPWFFYIGGAQQMDSFKNINGALNARVGFFLLADMLDLAVSVTETLSGNLEDESSSMITSIGLASKYYFPLKKNNLSPNLGAELAVSIPAGGEMAFTPSLLAGVSWFVGPGSFDAGLRIGNTYMVIVGYTLIPKLKSKK
ncbi:hypothetical protein EG830_00865 [bacterium]|nr:hypothetical protein [bacterium]